MTQPHLFHIPVMGTGFTIDTPVRIAKFGISSVMALGDDILIERMRKHHCNKSNEPYQEIIRDNKDARHQRITAYLNLVDRLVRRHSKALQASSFEPGSEITRYFEMLPPGDLRQSYHDMLMESNPEKKDQRQEALRGQAVTGSIDVNIMTKIDRDNFDQGEKLPSEYSDASSALRGYAESTLRSSIVFSAGMNPRLYAYIPRFKGFLPDQNGQFEKKVVMKVSDYRSAVVQGKYLAKRGVWISEYRMESGLNCGGHAFATKGLLMGPILEELKDKKEELIELLFPMYLKGLEKLGHPLVDTPPEVRITVQGGVGTAKEHNLLMDYYGIDATGWGTPFLLVPEVTNMDSVHRERLSLAGPAEVALSDHSPLGLPFWSLQSSDSEKLRLKRIDDGKHGSPCPKGYLAYDMQFSETPICKASRAFQIRKLNDMEASDISEEQSEAIRNDVLEKSCLCVDLAAMVMPNQGVAGRSDTAVCCGPGIVDFSQIISLDVMVNHIYGRAALSMPATRPHMFMRELGLYVQFLKQEINKCAKGVASRPPKYFREYVQNLHSGIEYYREFGHRVIDDAAARSRFLDDLDTHRKDIAEIFFHTPAQNSKKGESEKTA